MATETVIKRLVVKLEGNVRHYQNSLIESLSASKKYEDRVRATLRKVEQRLKDHAQKWSNFAGHLRSVGLKMSAAITAPLVGVIATVRKFAGDFNRAMANVATLGIVGERLQHLKREVQEVAIAVGKSTDDIAAGLYQVISAFGDDNDTIQRLLINAKAAKAGLATTVDAINLTSAVTKGYGDTTAKAIQHASDLAFVTVKLGQTSFPELASSMGKVIPLAAAMNVSQEKLFAVYATLTGVTGTASEVTTQFRGVLQGLMAPTADMTNLLKDLGYANGQVMLEQLGVVDTVKAIVKAADESGKPLQAYLSSIEAQTVALALAGAQGAVYEEKLKAIENQTNSTEEAFFNQTQTINKAGFTFEQLTIKLQVTAQRLGDRLAPAINKILEVAIPMIDKLAEMVEWFANLNEGTQIFILKLTGIAIAAGPVITALSVMASSVAGLVGMAGKIVGFAVGWKTMASAIMAVKVATAAAKLGLIGLVSYLSYKVAEAIYKSNYHVERYNHNLRRLKWAEDDAALRFEQETEEKVDKAKAIDTEEGQWKYLNEEMEQATKLVQGYEASLKGARKRVHELATVKNMTVGDLTYDMAQKELEEVERRLAQARERQEMLKAVGEEISMEQKIADMVSQGGEGGAKIPLTIEAPGEAEVNEAITTTQQKLDRATLKMRPGDSGSAFSGGFKEAFGQAIVGGSRLSESMRPQASPMSGAYEVSRIAAIMEEQNNHFSRMEELEQQLVANTKETADNSKIEVRKVQ